MGQGGGDGTAICWDGFIFFCFLFVSIMKTERLHARRLAAMPVEKGWGGMLCDSFEAEIPQIVSMASFSSDDTP